MSDDNPRPCLRPPRPQRNVNNDSSYDFSTQLRPGLLTPPPIRRNTLHMQFPVVPPRCGVDPRYLGPSIRNRIGFNSPDASRSLPPTGLNQEYLNPVPVPCEDSIHSTPRRLDNTRPRRRLDLSNVSDRRPSSQGANPPCPPARRRLDFSNVSGQAPCSPPARRRLDFSNMSYQGDQTLPSLPSEASNLSYLGLPPRNFCPVATSSPTEIDAPSELNAGFARTPTPNRPQGVNACARPPTPNRTYDAPPQGLNATYAAPPQGLNATYAAPPQGLNATYARPATPNGTYVCPPVQLPPQEPFSPFLHSEIYDSLSPGRGLLPRRFRPAADSSRRERINVPRFYERDSFFDPPDTPPQPLRRTRTFDVAPREINGAFERTNRTCDGLIQPVRGNATNARPTTPNRTYGVPPQGANATYGVPPPGANATYGVPPPGANATYGVPPPGVNATYARPANPNRVPQQFPANAGQQQDFSHSADQMPSSIGSFVEEQRGGIMVIEGPSTNWKVAVQYASKKTSDAASYDLEYLLNAELDAVKVKGQFRRQPAPATYEQFQPPSGSTPAR